MILENIRDKKLLELYEILTRSDFEGEMKDEFVVSILYIVKCLDSIQKGERTVKKNHLMGVAKEVARVYETSEKEEFKHISIMAWARASASWASRSFGSPFSSTADSSSIFWSSFSMASV